MSNFGDSKDKSPKSGQKDHKTAAGSAATAAAMAAPTGGAAAAAIGGAVAAAKAQDTRDDAAGFNSGKQEKVVKTLLDWRTDSLAAKPRRRLLWCTATFNEDLAKSPQKERLAFVKEYFLPLYIQCFSLGKDMEDALGEVFRDDPVARKSERIWGLPCKTTADYAKIQIFQEVMRAMTARIVKTNPKIFLDEKGKPLDGQAKDAAENRVFSEAIKIDAALLNLDEVIAGIDARGKHKAGDAKSNAADLELANRGAQLTTNCWGIILHAALESGVWNLAKFQAAVKAIQGRKAALGIDTVKPLAGSLFSGSLQPYENNLLRPARGDIVFFNGLSHVAIVSESPADPKKDISVLSFTPFEGKPGEKGDRIDLYELKKLLALLKLNESKVHFARSPFG